MSMESNQSEQGGFVRQRENGQRLSPAEMRAEIGQRVNEAPPIRDRRATNRSPRSSEQAKPGLIARLFSRSKRDKGEQRQNCCIVSVLMLLDRSLALDGLVLEMGRSTVLFRQGATFIFDRTGAEISVRFGEFDKRGRIKKVTERGYLIELFEPLSEMDVRGLLGAHGLPG